MAKFKLTLVRQNKRPDPETRRKKRTKVKVKNINEVNFKVKVKKGNVDMRNFEKDRNSIEKPVKFNIEIHRGNDEVVKISSKPIPKEEPVKKNNFNVKIFRGNEEITKKEEVVKNEVVEEPKKVQMSIDDFEKENIEIDPYKKLEALETAQEVIKSSMDQLISSNSIEEETEVVELTEPTKEEVVNDEEEKDSDLDDDEYYPDDADDFEDELEEDKYMDMVDDKFLSNDNRYHKYNKRNSRISENDF